MRKKIAIAALVCVAVFAAYVVVKAKDKNESDRRLTIAQHSYETGCYNFAQYHCAPQPEVQRHDCYTKAFMWCPKAALGFRKWIEDGK